MVDLDLDLDDNDDAYDNDRDDDDDDVYEEAARCPLSSSCYSGYYCCGGGVSCSVRCSCSSSCCLFSVTRVLLFAYCCFCVYCSCFAFSLVFWVCSICCPQDNKLRALRGGQ